MPNSYIFDWPVKYFNINHKSLSYFLLLGCIFWSRVNREVKLFMLIKEFYCILLCKLFSDKNTLLKVEENATCIVLHMALTNS